MIKKKQLYLFLILINTFQPLAITSSSSQKVIAITADAYVDSSNEGGNHGGSSYLAVSNRTYKIEITYLLFDLSSMQGDVITASLELTTTLVSETHDIGIHVCTSTAWDELSITYTNSPGYDAGIIDHGLVASDNTRYSWNVTSAFETALTGDKICFAVVSEDEHGSGMIWFASKETSLSQRKPVLEITLTGTNGQLGDYLEGLIILLIILCVSGFVILFVKKNRKAIFHLVRREKPVHEIWLTCDHCGNKNEPSMNFCINCGEKLPGSEGKDNLYNPVPLPKEQVIYPEKNIVPISHRDLSRFWYCPVDGTRLQEHVTRRAGNAYFTVSREKMVKGINDAIAMGKIPPEAFDQTRGLLEYIFSNSNFFNAELVSTECPSCGRIYTSPKL